jgi:carbon storage regulator
MLVLRRKIGERLVIAGVVTVTVLEVEGERVKLGITAPPDVAIVREELLGLPDPHRNISPRQRRST